MVVDLWKAEFACLVVGVVAFLGGWKFCTVIHDIHGTFSNKREK